MSKGLLEMDLPSNGVHMRPTVAVVAHRGASLLVVLGLSVLGVAGSACDLSFAGLTGRATDEWTRSYQLATGGEVRIANVNGAVDVEGVDGSTVDVSAERIARATTDRGARELLSRIEIREDVRPDRVSIETGRPNGILLGASIEVRYHVRAPKSAKIDLTNTNGRITINDVTGSVVAHTTNGGIRGKALTGGVDARVTNGGVVIDLASVSNARVSLRSTNGGVSLTLPSAAKADLSASCTNGAIRISGLTLEMSEQSRRRVEGRLNGGGTPIELHTTNGGVRVSARGNASEGTDES
jgi:hypothetical protein